MDDPNGTWTGMAQFLRDLSASLPMRQRLGAHRANPACAGCHNILDPVGLGLEHFDAIGRYRETYATGLPVDAVGKLTDAMYYYLRFIRLEPKDADVRYNLGLLFQDLGRHDEDAACG